MDNEQRKHPFSAIFPLGRFAFTSGVMGTLSPCEIANAVGRHSCGDWGELDPEDWAENERALKEGLRLFSVYTSRKTNARFYVMTEADRSVTTVLHPEEY